MHSRKLINDNYPRPNLATPYYYFELQMKKEKEKKSRIAFRYFTTYTLITDNYLIGTHYLYTCIHVDQLHPRIAYIYAIIPMHGLFFQPSSSTRFTHKQ